MSVQNVRDAITTFLSDTDPQVMCIRGAWGTGKTYTWDDVLGKMSKDGKIPLPRYAKVSLFGLNSVSEIKREIFQSTISTSQIGKPFDIKNFKSLYAGVKSHSGIFLKAVDMFLDNASDAAAEAVGLMARNMLVCVDDLERKGKDLRSVDVLGYISQLRMERTCKVVLLLNDAQLEDKDEFEAYLEKVVDIHLRFEPTAEQVAYIAIPETDTIAALVRGNAIELGISNVRVIRKILTLVRYVVPLLSKYSMSVTNNAAATITLFGWSYFQPEFAPPLEYLKRVMVMAPAKDDAELDLKWRDVLYGYNFTHAADFDLELLKGIEAGYFREEAIDVHAASLDRADVRYKADMEMRAIWDDMHYSFTKPASDVLERFFEHYLRNGENLTMGDMAILERLFRDLGDARNEQIVEHYIKVNADDKDALDPAQLERYGTELPEFVRESLAVAMDAHVPKLSPDELLVALGTRGFEQDIYKPASELPVSEYIRVLKSHEGSKLSDILNGLRQYLTVGNAGEEMQTIMDKAGEALREISKESPINRRRAVRPGLIQRLEAKEAGAAEAGNQPPGELH